MEDRLSDSWFREALKYGDILTWVSNLDYFYFFRAAGAGTSNDDRFETRITYGDNNDLIEKLKKLGIELSTMSEEALTAKKSKYRKPTPEEIKKREMLAKSGPILAQPRQQVISGVPVFVWITNVITISVSGINGEDKISEEDFEACKKLEAIFDDLHWAEFKDTEGIESDICCLSEQRYPEIFDPPKEDDEDITLKDITMNMEKRPGCLSRLFGRS